MWYMETEGGLISLTAFADLQASGGITTTGHIAGHIRLSCAFSDQLLRPQAHHMTRQVEYRGDVISLTEALVGFPAGGQVLLSDSTYQRIYGRLDTIHLKEYTKARKKQGTKGTSLTGCEASA